MAAFASGQLSALDTTAKGRCWNGILQDLIDENLEGITTRWYIMRQPWISKVGTYPCGVVSEFRGAFPDSSGPANQADTEFRFIIAVARGNNFDHQNDAELMLEWDQAIRRLFRKKSTDWLDADATTRLNQVTVSDGESFLDEAFRRGVDALFFLVTVEVREPIS